MMKLLCLLLTPLFLLANGIEYRLWEREELIIHILEIDPSQVDISLINNAIHEGKGTETTSCTAKQHEALAAINGGFFKGAPLEGAPSGILRIEGIDISPTDRNRGAIGWNSTEIHIDRLDSNHSYCHPFYHPDLQSEWEEFPYILGATPVLIIDGQIVADFFDEQVRTDFVVKKRARTAIGLKENGSLIAIVVEGGDFEKNSGVTMQELAELMLELGAVEALNLDGGGSSSLYYKARLYPHFWIEERSVGNVLIFKERSCD